VTAAGLDSTRAGWRSRARVPKVCIGLPVHNGERYLASALEAILAQTYPNLEVIVSDNASDDQTEAICRRFSARDRRVRYLRQARNRGAAANFNHVFAEARHSRYFKWAACDDWIAPTFVERCVGALERHPDAVLCQSRVKVVDEHDRVVEEYDHAAFGTGRPRVSERFRARLQADRCMDIFGLIRTDVLTSTPLIDSHLGADRTLLLELALRGRFLSLPDYLFFNCDHEERFTRRTYAPSEELAWYAPEGARRAVWRTWTLYGKSLQLIRRIDDPAERRRCLGHLLRSLANRRRLTNLALEPLVGSSPRLFFAVQRLKRALRGHRSRRHPVGAIQGGGASEEASP
jgi:glycosyltransferase involved in cell wall biosynthesis